MQFIAFLQCRRDVDCGRKRWIYKSDILQDKTVKQGTVQQTSSMTFFSELQEVFYIIHWWEKMITQLLCNFSGFCYSNAHIIIVWGTCVYAYGAFHFIHRMVRENREKGKLSHVTWSWRWFTTLRRIQMT